MFNLESLNDYEFEILCKDIMERKLAVTLFTFTKGPDGGIDICDSKKNANIIIQAKHYYKSAYSKLKSELKKEIQKICKLDPKRYFVCTSKGLSKNNKNEIFEMFCDYMEDTSNIIGRDEINSFLEKDENKDIVRKNYKLWLSASNVLSLINNQNIFIDCDELLADIDNSHNFFVETSAYREAMQKLDENNIVIIIGGPGVGKSTLSKMLILKYSSEGFAVHYTTDNNIKDIKKSLSLDISKKEIVLLDDFLGQHYLNIKESQPNEINSLISFIKRNPNKRIILNSRITILNEAKEKFVLFKNLMERNEKDTYLIDLNNMSKTEKAEIFYNHIYFNELSRGHFLDLKENKRYFNIINHKSYNPRIIEYVTKKRNYELIPPNEYYNYVIRKLDEPEDVWRDEFCNRLSETDRILMNELYSLTNTSIDRDILEESFNKRMRTKKYDSSINVFNSSIKRLTNSLLCNTEDKGKIKVTVINPSINDYLNLELKTNINEQIEIIKSAIYIEQIIKVANSKEAKQYIKSMILSGKILAKQTLKNSPFYYYIQLVIKFKLFNKGIESNFKLSFERMYISLSDDESFEYGELIKIVSGSKFINYYSLNDTFNDVEKIRCILKPVDLDHLNSISENLLNQSILDITDEFKFMLKGLMAKKISNIALSKADDQLGEIVSCVLNRMDINDIYYYKNDDSDYIENSVWDEICACFYEEIDNLLSSISEMIEISTDDFDANEFRLDFDIINTINSYLRAEEDYDDYYDRWRESRGTSEIDIIQEMFER